MNSRNRRRLKRSSLGDTAPLYPLPPPLPAPGVSYPATMYPPPPTSYIPPGTSSVPAPVPPPPYATSNPLDLVNVGLTSYQQLVRKHTILKTPVMSPAFLAIQVMSLYDPNAISQKYWYTHYAGSLQKLVQIALPLEVSKIEGMIAWLSGVEPGRKYTPDEMLLLVEKLCLGQKVSFPEIELPARIIRFLKTSLRFTVTGAQEKTLSDQRDGLRRQEYTALQAVIQAQAKVTLAEKETGTSSYLQNLQDAEGQLAIQQRTLDSVRSQIATVNQKLSDLQARILTDEEVANYLAAHLSPGPAHDAIMAAWSQYQRILTEAPKYVSVIQNAQAQVEAAMAPIRIQTAADQNTMIAARAVYTASPTTANQQAYQSALNVLSSDQALMAPLTQQSLALTSQLQAVIQAHPDLFPEGSVTTSDAGLNKIVVTALQKSADSSPQDLITLVESAMEILSSDADSRASALQASRDQDIQERQSLFETYLRAKIEAEVQYFHDQMQNAQDGYNELGNEINALVSKVQGLQNQISANMQTLGQVIGWWCHMSNVTPEQMNQPSFIGKALTAVAALQGKYDVVNINTGTLGIISTQTFWSGPGRSQDLANDTLMLLQQLDNANVEYQTQAPTLKTRMDEVSAWMQQIANAFQVTSRKLNSQDYAKQAALEFNQSPEGKLLQSDIDAVSTPLKEISIMIESYQQTMNQLIEDIELDAITSSGMTFRDPASLSYEEKKHAWYGTGDYLKKAMPRIPELQGYIGQMVARIQAGQPQDGDADNLTVAKQGVLNILAGQLLFRKLQNDSDFQLSLSQEKESNAKAGVENSHSA